MSELKRRIQEKCYIELGNEVVVYRDEVFKILDEVAKEFQPFKCGFNLVVELCPKTDLSRSEITASHCMQCLQEEAINKSKAFKKWFGESK